MVISRACRSVDGIGVVSAWQLLRQFGALLDGKRSGLFCPSRQSWNKQAGRRSGTEACHCLSASSILSSCPANSATFFFLLLEICVQFEKGKKFQSTVVLNSGKYYIYRIESIGLSACVLIFTYFTTGISVYRLLYLQAI